jgi:hypothetical protein
MLSARKNAVRCRHSCCKRSNSYCIILYCIYSKPTADHSGQVANISWRKNGTMNRGGEMRGAEGAEGGGCGRGVPLPRQLGGLGDAGDTGHCARKRDSPVQNGTVGKPYSYS